MKKKSVLFYDIETLMVPAYIWRLGEQVVRHNQLLPNDNTTQLICITYCINKGPVKAITRDLNTIKSQKSMIEQFDALVAECDIVVGKNSAKFDNKHINTIRLLEGVKAVPDWVRYTDDLEKQMRKYFNLQSYGLDYFSGLLGYGGKSKMEYADWVAIKEWFKLLLIKEEMILFGAEYSAKTENALCHSLFNKKAVDVFANGIKAHDKMVKYGKKDTADTRDIWYDCVAHFEPKINLYKEEGRACQQCGSTDLSLDRKRSGNIVTWYCNEHKGYAGRSRILKKPRKGGDGYGSML